MKRSYYSPQMEVIEIAVESAILSASSTRTGEDTEDMSDGVDVGKIW